MLEQPVIGYPGYVPGKFNKFKTSKKCKEYKHKFKIKFIDY